MSRITTHVLDTVLGQPAVGLAVSLEMKTANGWNVIATKVTDTDGRCRDLIEEASPGIYRLTFEVGAYLSETNRRSIYPEIQITVTCDADTHYHLPLLLSGNSYTTYRGS